MSAPSPFKWRHFQADIILCAMRWYPRYALSYRIEGLTKRDVLTQNHVINQLSGLAA